MADCYFQLYCFVYSKLLYSLKEEVHCLVESPLQSFCHCIYVARCFCSWHACMHINTLLILLKVSACVFHIDCYRYITRIGL